MDTKGATTGGSTGRRCDVVSPLRRAPDRDPGCLANDHLGAAYSLVDRRPGATGINGREGMIWKGTQGEWGGGPET